MRWWALGMMLAVSGCGGTKLPDPICNPSANPWWPGTRAFSEVTEDWGLAGVEGVKLAAVDFDGDGWVDLHVHRGGSGRADDFGAEGTRHSWLLRNDEGRGFIDVTEASGFRTPRAPDGALGRPGTIVAFADIDNDGDLDAFTGVNDPNGEVAEDSEILVNQGDGTFRLGAPDMPWKQNASAPAGATFVDVDKDGNLDLWVPQNSVGGRPQQDKLYKGFGNGAFSDGTLAAGLETEAWGGVDALNAGLAHTNAWSANACDVNDDGWPDLLAASYGRAPNHLWQNSGRGTFANRAVASGYAYDENQDYSDNQFFLCFCQSNRSAPGCASAPTPSVGCAQVNWSEPRDREPYRNGGNSGATSCRDIDNDGDIDLLTGEIQHWWAGAGSDEAQILVNDGASDVHFDRPGVQALGLTRELPGTSWDKGDMTNSLIDFDNDGWADVYIGSSDYEHTRGLLWHQDAPMSFSPVAIEDYFDHSRSHGVAVADFDRDGDLDIIVGHSRQRCGGTSDCYETQQVRLFRNNVGRNFVQLELEGAPGANRSAIGARVKVTAGEITQTFEINGGYGLYGAQNPLLVHAGLDQACEADVEIRWPDTAGTIETFTVPAGYHLKFVQGAEDQPTVRWPIIAED